MEKILCNEKKTKPRKKLLVNECSQHHRDFHGDHYDLVYTSSQISMSLAASAKFKKRTDKKNKITMETRKDDNCHKDVMRGTMEKASSQRIQLANRRPEPEGGNSTLSLYSECVLQRLINSTEPLFSDNELSDEESIRHSIKTPRRCRLSSDLINDTGYNKIVIPYAQLGSSSTMMKYAIIGTEVQNLLYVSYRVSNQ